MFPAFKPARVDTILLVCPGRLSWRHRARPSATLHETQACPLGANLNDFFVPQGENGRKADCSEWCIPVPQRSWKTDEPHLPKNRVPHVSILRHGFHASSSYTAARSPQASATGTACRLSVLRANRLRLRGSG